jgi:hypothetical protein
VQEQQDIQQGQMDQTILGQTLAVSFLCSLRQALNLLSVSFHTVTQ